VARDVEASRADLGGARVVDTHGLPDRTRPAGQDVGRLAAQGRESRTSPLSRRLRKDPVSSAGE
jgi:hypothetical protein